jgi:hypothetical protein
MPTLTEGKYTAESRISCTEAGRSREQITVITGQNLAAGTVVGKITASGKYTILAPAAVDGSQTAAGVLYGAVDATAADKKGVIINMDAQVNGAELTYPGGITAPQKATAINQLFALGIKVR